MRQAITSAYENWDSKVPKLRQEAKTLREQNTTTIKKIDELENLQSGKNPLRWLFNKIARWQQLPELETQLAANNKRLQIIASNIQYTANQCAAQICKAYVSDNKDIAAQRKALLDTVDQAREERKKLSEALEHTDKVLGDIDNVWQEALLSEDVGRLDAYCGLDAGVDGWSHTDAEDIVKVVQTAKVSLENFVGYYNRPDRLVLTPVMTGVANIDCAFIQDKFGNLTQKWSNWENELDEIKQSLMTIRDQIEDIRNNLVIAHEAAARKEDEVLTSLSSFRKDILQKIAQQGGLEAKRFLADVIEHMSADEVAMRSDRRPRLEANFG